MDIKEILDTIKSVKLCLMAHPDNEEGSEFADRIDDLTDIEVKLDRLESYELQEFLDDNIERSKCLSNIKTDNGDNPLFMAGWIAALMHVKLNYLQQLNNK
ncbi:MAG: hypothetical protein IPJ81_06660 [Chitinophagaceae bacterium]|nr:hypothetical protein [Chitinophagaceae bacterium]